MVSPWFPFRCFTFSLSSISMGSNHHRNFIHFFMVTSSCLLLKSSFLLVKNRHFFADEIATTHAAGGVGARSPRDGRWTGAPGPDTGLEGQGFRRLVEPERVRHGFSHGFGENLQENPIFNGKNHGFRLRFSLKPIQRDEFSTKWPCLWWFWWWIISG